MSKLKPKFQNAALQPGCLLVSTIADPYYGGMVILLLEHNTKQSIGITINKPYEGAHKYQDFITRHDAKDILAAQAPEDKNFIFGGYFRGESEPRRLFIINNKAADTGAAPEFNWFDTVSKTSFQKWQLLAEHPSKQTKVAIDFLDWDASTLNYYARHGSFRVLPYDNQLVFETPLKDIFPLAAKKAGLHDEYIKYVSDTWAFVKEKGGWENTEAIIKKVRPKKPQKLLKPAAEK